ncbi:MAG TPA: lysophospholipid acyltransferase family protein [Candidatus Binataceae bacterium]|nr:lysophospholipid acyltransferase family protein [Candidatus Binataceae bacterium]
MEREAEASQVVTTCKAGILNRMWGVIATILAIIYTALLALPAAALSFFQQGHLATPVIRCWSWLILRTCGISIEVEGIENLDRLKSFVLVSNHKSLFDILAVIDLIPREMRFVAKREIKKIPVIGFILGRCGNVVIDRESGGREIRRALEVMRSGYSICVFAEGHRFNDDRVHEFSEGAAWMGIVSKLPCVPMAISGTMAIMPRGSKFVSPGRRIRITIGKPIETKELRSGNRVELTRHLEAEVAAAFHPEI